MAEIHYKDNEGKFQKITYKDVGAAAADHTHEGIGIGNYLPLTGGKLTGQLTILTGTNPAVRIYHGVEGVDAAVEVERSDVNVGVGLMVGAGGVNHGIWSYKLNKWMMHGDGEKVYLNGNSEGANYAMCLNSLETITYGANRLQYFNKNVTAGCAAKVNDGPTSDYWHFLRFNHGNTQGYYTDLAVPFNNNGFYYKRVQAGELKTPSWIQLIDAYGGTINRGSLTIGSPNVNQITVPSSTQYGNIIYFTVGAAAEKHGTIQPTHYTNGQRGMVFGVQRTLNSTVYYNMVTMRIGNDSTKTDNKVTVFDDPAAWCAGLGLGRTSGAVPVANGGTGATAKGKTLLANIGISCGTTAPTTNTAKKEGEIYIQYA